jgi:hypothetical protein
MHFATSVMRECSAPEHAYSIRHPKLAGYNNPTEHFMAKEKDSGRQGILWVITVILIALAAWMYFKR